MPSDEDAALGVLRLVVAEAAHRLGADAVGLVGLGGRYGLADPLGDLAGPVPTRRGGRPFPTRAPPTVVARETVEPTALTLLPDALAQVPADVLPVVTTTWALTRLTPERRLSFLRLLDAAATHRTVAWVSVEGVGVAPGVPTLGDRPASGHSIVGLAVLRHGSLAVDAVGRCWSRGRWLAWLVDG